MPKNKFGDISALLKTTEAGKGNDETDSSTAPPKKELNSVPNQKTSSTNDELPNILHQQSIKKTFEMKLVYDVAIESLKAERKRKNRFQTLDKPMTNNGIMDEVLENFFSQPENRQYLESAISDLSQN